MTLPITHGRGRPVPDRLRNPRRAYDVDGREIAPMTLQQAIDSGIKALRAICDCGHAEEVPIYVGNWPSTSFVPDAGMMLRCRACAKPDLRTEPAWPRQGAEPRLPGVPDARIGTSGL